MRTADPQRVANEAMVAFADAMRTGVDRVGVISYAGQVVEQRGLSGLYCEVCRDDLHGFIRALDYASWTDHSAGLLAALDMLAPFYDTYRTHTIIFFTDGNLNVSPAVRTNAAAQEDVDRAIAYAAERAVAIHTIGLNYDGNLDTGYLQLIAYATGGLAFTAVYAGEIPDIITAILAAKHIYIEAPPEYIAPEAEAVIQYEPVLAPEPYEELYGYTESYEYDPAPPRWPFAAAVLVLLAALVLFMRVRSPRRVFTGSLSISHSGQTTTHQLIGHGRRVALSALLPAGHGPALSHVILTPCPLAPSHLPHLRIKSLGPVLCKDYAEVAPHLARSGISLAPGGEATVSLDDAVFHLKYS
jgi:hypothetical protein